MYHITVGEERPLTKKMGVVEPNTGFTVAKEKGETLAKRGDCGFPNGTKIWAARVINGQIPKDDKGNFINVAVTDPNYKGEIKRLKWGAAGGSLIDVRYIKGYPSLDVLYQERVLNFKIDETNENSAEFYMLTFPNGDNDIDDNIDPLLVEHLKGHSYNGNSESKDPNFNTIMFWEKSFEQQEKFESKILDEKFEAAKIVREMATGGDEMVKCKNLVSIVRSLTDEVPEDTKLYAYLKMIADQKPTQFLRAIANYKKNVSNTFEKLKSYDAIDVSIDGAITAGKEKKELLVTDLPAKSKVIFDYLLTNYTDPTVFEVTFKLIKISDKLK